MEPLRTILVPFDFTRASMAAFDAALRLRTDDTAVTVLHVIDDGRIEFVVELGYAMPDEVEQKARTHAETRLRRLTSLPEGADGAVDRIVVRGRPVAKILDLARELEADLVVVGTPPAELAGSVPLPGTMAEQVFRHAGCPVLVIPGDAGLAEVQDETASDAPAGAPSAS